MDKGNYIKRRIDDVFHTWKGDLFRKPMLLRGARQTGKTSAVRNFGKTYDTFIELNFEKNPELAKIFAGPLDVVSICSQIESFSRKRILPGKTLLFLDEIQVCPRAISSLRYFHEDAPGIHVVATGSLLEFVFSEMKDFGVGRIRNVFMQPFSFSEFLAALGEDMLLERMGAAGFDAPLDAVAHESLLELLKAFLLVGGMPAAVNAYAQTRSFLTAAQMHGDIMTSLKADFGKYGGRVPAGRIRQALSSVVRQTGEKFTYTDSLLGLSYAQSKEATELLELSRLAVRTSSCRGNGLPLGSDVNPKANKFMLLDTGLYLHECGLDLFEGASARHAELINRGRLAEAHVGLELLKAGDPFREPNLYYWHREARNSNAEVDYLVQHGGEILPIEVKSGLKGRMRSMEILMAEKGMAWGVRTSQENLGRIPGVFIIPLYMISEYARLCRRDGQVPWP